MCYNTWMNSITLTELLETFRLSPDFNLIRIKSTRKDYVDIVAGSVNAKGYLKVRCNGKIYSAHRIIYQIANSIERLPEDIQIDHIDGNRLNNNPSNLRMASNQDNQRNVKIQRNNTSGFKGVTYEKNRNKWKASIYDGTRRINLGRFDSPEEAHLAYKNKAIELFKEFARV